MCTIFISFVVETVLLITYCFTVTTKGVISDLIGVLYLFCFHSTYDDRVDRRTVSYTHLDVYKRQAYGSLRPSTRTFAFFDIHFFL